MYKFNIFDSMLYITGPNLSTGISADSDNFDLIRAALIRADWGFVDNLIKAEHGIDFGQLTEIDGLHYFRDFVVPTSLTTLLRRNKTAGAAAINFYINKVTNGETVHRDTLIAFTGDDVAPIDKSGFLFATRSKLSGPEFINGSELSESNWELLKSGIDSICENVLGGASKAIVRAAKKLILESGQVSDSFFNCCYFINAYSAELDPTVVVQLLQSDLGTAINTNSRDNIKAVAGLFSAIYSPSKLLRLLDDKQQVSELRHNFKTAGDCWRDIEGNFKLKDRYQNFTDLIDWLTVTAKKQKSTEYQLHQVKNHHWLTKLPTEIGPYSVRVAATNYELIDWSNELGNCLATYADRAKRGQLAIVGLMQGDSIKFAIEIKANGSIGQFEGKSRANPDTGLVKEVTQIIGRAYYEAV